MTEIIRKTVAAQPVGGDPLDYVLSDAGVDRYGDVIAVEGWQLANFKKNPIALFGHNSEQPIGTWSNVRVEDGRLVGRLKLLGASGDIPFINYIHALVREGILRAVSVGFRALQREPLDPNEKKGFGPWRFLKSELVEASLVSVPANPGCLQITKALGVPAAMQAMIFGPCPADGEIRTRAVVSGMSAVKPKIGSSTMTTPTPLGKRIENAQAEYTRLRDLLTELSARDDLTDEDAVQFEELPDLIERAQKTVGNLEKAERALAPRVSEQPPMDGEIIPPNKANGSSNGQRPWAVPKKKINPIDFLVRATAVQVKSFVSRQPLERVFQDTYGSDEATGLVLRAAVNPAMTTTVGWAAELVETVNADFLDLLRPVSIYTQLASKGSRFTFGRAGAIRVPSRAATPRLAGSFVGEGAPKPVRRAGFTSILLQPHKMAVISLFTEEIAEHSTPAIEQLIRDGMRDDTAEAIDAHLIDNVAASAIRPAGLLNGLTTLTPSTDPDPTKAMLADMRALIGSIVTANGGRRITLLMNSAQQMGINFATTPNGLLFSGTDEAGRRLGVDFIFSNAVPAGTIIAVDAADFASATGDVPRYSVSNEATVHEEDTTPLALVTGAQGSGVVASPMRSLWQTDTIGVRMTWPLSWAMRRAGMVAFISGVAW